VTPLLRRVSVTVPEARSEEARAVMLELFPEGFEELEGGGGAVELAAYTNAAGEERIWQAFGGAATADVEDDWLDRWRQFHRPVRVGELWIGPPWETPDPGALAVVIDPGRAFGTGGHPTTQLCLRLLAAEERGSVLDVGCGSGVLSIAAAKLGFAPVHAVDFDEQAVEATARNAAENAVEVAVSRADLREDPLRDADLALANIAADAVLALGLRLRAARAITSGYLVSDELELPGYRRERRVEEGGWAADVHVRQ
jgi:ribosomal protein L11 methyltransferase